MDVVAVLVGDQRAVERAVVVGVGLAVEADVDRAGGERGAQGGAVGGDAAVQRVVADLPRLAVALAGRQRLAQGLAELPAAKAYVESNAQLGKVVVKVG